MPKFIPHRHWVAWLSVFVFALVPCYFLVTHPLITGFCIGTLSALTIATNQRHRRRMMRLCFLRRGEGICEFARSIDFRKVDTWVIRAVYEELQSYLGPKWMVPIRASDHLTEVLRIDMEDLEIDLASRIAQRTGRSLANTEGNPHFDGIRTVADLVTFFDAQPRSKSVAFP